MNNARIKILKNIIKHSQTVPTMKMAPKPPTNQVTPAPKAAPAATAPKPDSNVIEPQKPVQTQQPQQPKNTVPTTPVVENKQPQTQTQPVEPEVVEEKKEGDSIYEIVKKAIDEKKDSIITAKYYYENLNSDDASYLKDKTFAAVDVNGIMKISKIKDENSIVENNIMSLYEPVVGVTKNFTIGVFSNELADVVRVSNKLGKMGIGSDIYKFADRYELRCNSRNELSTKVMLEYLDSITSDMKVDLSNLKIGKLKRLSFSLDNNGNEGTLIRVG